MKFPLLILLPVVLLATVSVADEVPDSGLQRYLDHARMNHPQLRELEAAVNTARAESRLAGALPGLKLGWGQMLVPVETRVGPQQRVLSISQGMPWPGTLGERRQAGEALAQARVEKLRAGQARIAGDVRRAWYRLALLQQQLDLVKTDLLLARQNEAAERARYEGGEGAYRVVLQAQMRSASLESKRSDLEDRIVTAAAQLRTAAAAPADWPVPVAELPVANAGQEPDRTRLHALLISNNPGLAALRREETGARHGLGAAAKAKFPDLSLGIDFVQTDRAAMDVQDSGRDPVVLKLGATLPLWGGRADAARQAAAGRLQGTSSRLRAETLRLEAALDGQFEELKTAQRRLALLSGELIPRADQLVGIVTAEVASSRADLSDLITARTNRLALQTDALQAAHDLAVARSEISVLLDMPWDGIDPSGPGRKEG